MYKTLQEVIREHHLVTDEQLEECKAICSLDPSRGMADVLMDMEYVGEEQLASAFCESLDLVRVNPLKHEFHEPALSSLPERTIRKYRIVPLALQDQLLTIAVMDPTRLPMYDTIEMVTGLTPVAQVSTRSEILEAIEHRYGRGRGHDDDLMEDIEPHEDDDAIAEIQRTEDEQHVNVDVAGSEAEPVVRIVRRILRDAFDKGASDIHVEPFEKFISLRYRIDGELEDLKRPPKVYQENIIARLKILSGCRIDEHRIPQDGRISVYYEERKIDLRVAFLPCRHGEKVVLRVLDQSSLAVTLDSLGFEPQPMRDFQHALTRPNGMVLVTGPTGSGKTTTLYSVLNDLNTRKVNIVTVEDPIEYEIIGVNQVQTKSSVGLTFANALRQILRQDPDIVMIGEMRDSETADVGVKAALTGHLVLTTLHTNDAAGVYPRLIDMGVEPFLVQSSVLLSSAQRLLRRVCPDCAEEDVLSEEILHRSQFNHEEFDGAPVFMKGVGCTNCRNTGYKGRLAVIEVMLNHPEISALAVEHASAQAIKKAAIATGMKTLRQNAMAKAARGLTTVDEAIARTYDD